MIDHNSLHYHITTFYNLKLLEMYSKSARPMSNKLQDLYVRQLYIGCDNANCRMYFCRSNMSKTCLLKISEILTNYDEYFLCFNNRTKEQVKINFTGKSYPILDFYMYVSCKDLVLPDPLSEHSFCTFFKKKNFTEDEKILIEGVLSMLLQQYADYNEDILSHIIIRLFSQILSKIKLKNEIFENISEIFLNIDRLCHELALEKEKKAPFNENIEHLSDEKSTCNDCLFNDVFTEKDLKNLIRTIYAFLNNAEYDSVRSSRRTEELLNIFHILFCVNEIAHVVCYKEFYLNKFCESQNLKEEIRLNKQTTRQ